MSFHFCLISVILLFLLQLKKSICFTFFAHQLFLGQIAWADTLDVSGGKVSHCTVPVCRGVWGLLLCLCGPSAERWLAICVRHYSFVLPSFNRWNVLFIVNVTTPPHQLVFIYLFNSHPVPVASCMLPCCYVYKVLPYCYCFEFQVILCSHSYNIVQDKSPRLALMVFSPDEDGQGVELIGFPFEF